jgi:hypothetical protein
MITREPPEPRQTTQQNGGTKPTPLQIIGEATWDVAKPERGGEITLAHAKDAEQAVWDELESMFQARWQAATNSEKQFLKAMASHRGDTVPRAAVAQTLGLATTDLSMARQSLIAKGVIEAPRYGQLRFTVPGFDRFVSSQGDAANSEAGRL